MTIELNPEALRELRYRESLNKTIAAARELALEVRLVANEPPSIPTEDFLSYVIDAFCKLQVDTVTAMQTMLEGASSEGVVHARDLKEQMLSLASIALSVVTAIEVPVAEFRETNQLKH